VSSRPIHVAVYCGSSSGFDSGHREAAAEVGRLLAEGGHRLVYGGGDVGLMGVVADAVLAGGGEVVGVITEHLAALEVQHGGLTELHVVDSMHERKALMAALADGVIALPGGYGTLDETFEILTWNQLGLAEVAVAFLDVDGFYGGLFDWVAGAVTAGFVRPEHGALAQRAATPADAVRIAVSAAPAFTPKWSG
jgi:uncharacterized protein (TIGR00730 family)